MKSSFDIDNPFFAFMGALADIVMVNLLFLICSVPVVTMGASMAAMYETMRILQKRRLQSAFHCFFTAFRHHFKKSIPLWLVQLLTGVLLFFDLNVASSAPKTPAWNIIGMVAGGLFLIWTMAACYLFPAHIYAGKTIRQALAKSMYLAVRNLPYTVVMAVLNSIPIVCLMLGTYFIGVVTPVYLAAGFGMTAYINTMLLERCNDICV